MTTRKILFLEHFVLARKQGLCCWCVCACVCLFASTKTSATQRRINSFSVCHSKVCIRSVSGRLAHRARVREWNLTYQHKVLYNGLIVGFCSASLTTCFTTPPHSPACVCVCVCIRMYVFVYVYRDREGGGGGGAGGREKDLYNVSLSPVAPPAVTGRNYTCLIE